MRTDSFIFRRVAGIVVIVAIAAVFFISAWEKLRGISSFEWTFIQILHVNGRAAAVLARAFIGLEALLGGLLLGHLFLKSFTYKAIISLLGFFCIYLFIQLAHYGNSANCGCFGDDYYMSPLAAIAKNVAMIIGVILLWKYYPEPQVPQPVLFALPLAIAAFTLPFTINKIAERKLDLKPLQAYAAPLSRGRHVVAFLSLTCPHCRKAGQIISKQFAADSTLPYFIVTGGNKEAEKDFWAETGAEKVPHLYLANMAAFEGLAGKYVPAIYWLNNAVAERSVYYTDLIPYEIKAWANH